MIGTVLPTFCQTCLYWDDDKYAENRGACRCHPPQAVGEDDIWPATKPHDWCGEWKRKAYSKEEKPEGPGLDYIKEGNTQPEGGENE